MLKATFSPDGKHVLTAGRNPTYQYTARLWDAAETGQLLGETPSSSGDGDITWSADGSYVAANGI